MIPLPRFDASSLHILSAHALSIQLAIDGCVSLEEAAVGLGSQHEIGTDADAFSACCAAHLVFLASRGALGDHKDRQRKND